MKTAYVKPTMMFEGFQPTEYVAACYVNVQCVGSNFYNGGYHDCDGRTSLIRTGASDPDRISTGTSTELYKPAENRNFWELLLIYLFSDERWWNRPWSEFADTYLNNQPIAGNYWIHNELGGHILTQPTLDAYKPRPNHS